MSKIAILTSIEINHRILYVEKYFLHGLRCFVKMGHNYFLEVVHPLLKSKNGCLELSYILAVTNLFAFGGLHFKIGIVIPPVAGLN